LPKKENHAANIKGRWHPLHLTDGEGPTRLLGKKRGGDEKQGGQTGVQTARNNSEAMGGKIQDKKGNGFSVMGAPAGGGHQKSLQKNFQRYSAGCE